MNSCRLRRAPSFPRVFLPSRVLVLLLPLLLLPLLLSVAMVRQASAHWCSNIWIGPGRLVVKPERSTVYVSGQVKLRVYLQNNFPYKIFGVQMRGTASGYTFSSPPSRDINPGQNVAYDFTISGPTGNLAVTATLQVQFRIGTFNSSSLLVNQSPSQSTLVSGSVYNQGIAQQGATLVLATLFDLYPAATLGGGAPTFGRTAVKQLIHAFGYHYCYDEGGSWVCAGQDCPSPCGEQQWSNPNDINQFAQNCMRAGVELGVRKAKLGNDLDAARSGAVNGLKGSNEHKCVAAVVGGYLWQGASDTTPFTSALADGSHGVPAICQAAGRRALDGSNASSCGSGQYYERAACAAAEGLNNNDGPVVSILMASAGDGDNSGSYDSLYYAYMLYLVQGYRRATGGGVVPFYPDAGGPLSTDVAVTPPPDRAPPKKDQAPAKRDGRPPGAEGAGPATEAGAQLDGLPPTESGQRTEASVQSHNTLVGGCGCSLGAAETPAPTLFPLLLLLLVLLVLLLLRLQIPRKSSP